MRICCLRCVCFDLKENNISAYIPCIRCLRIMWYTPKWHYRVKWRRQLLNKVVILVFFAHKKYSQSFVKLRSNRWYHMDYLNDLLATFLSLDRVRTLGVYGGSESSRNASNILIYVPTWGGVINDRIFIFGWTIPLSAKTKCLWPWSPSSDSQFSSVPQSPALSASQPSDFCGQNNTHKHHTLGGNNDPERISATFSNSQRKEIPSPETYRSTSLWHTGQQIGRRWFSFRSIPVIIAGQSYPFLRRA